MTVATTMILIDFVLFMYCFCSVTARFESAIPVPQHNTCLLLHNQGRNLHELIILLTKVMSRFFTYRSKFLIIINLKYIQIIINTYWELKKHLEFLAKTVTCRWPILPPYDNKSIQIWRENRHYGNTELRTYFRHK